tara:strand:- start:223 stop:660 length:438 start_codon:yes stop_codon:yes gene_type:complete
MTSKTKIYVGGTFDCFHRGHVNLLRQAKNVADYVIVALNSDDFATSYKCQPIMNEIERLDVIRSCKYVDMSFIMEAHNNQKKYIEMIKPNFILHGNDWTGDSLINQLGISQEFLDDNEIKMHYVPYTIGISTSDIKDRIINQQTT